MRVTAFTALSGIVLFGCGAKEASNRPSIPGGSAPGFPVYDLSIHVVGHGTVVSTALAASCDADCHVSIRADAIVQLVAQPAAGSTFSAWQGGCSSSDSCNLLMSGDTQVTAVFSPSPPAPGTAPPAMAVLIVEVDGSGDVTSDPLGIDCRSGIGNCGASFPVGVTVALSATAASGVRFVGWAGACSGTAGCAITVSDRGPAQVLAAFDARAVDVLAANTGSVIALNSNDVFYASMVQPYLPQSTEMLYVVRAVSKNGGAARDVAVSPAYVVAMLANDQWVYWTAGDRSQGRLYRAPAQGGAAETLFIGQWLSDIALDEANVYFANFSGQGVGNGAVYALPISGGFPSVLASNVTPLGGLTADATDVYFSDDPPDGSALERVSKSGGPPITVIPSGDFRALRADSQSIYYLDFARAINAWSKRDGSITTVVPSANAIDDFTVSGTELFWTIDFDARHDPNPDPRPGLKRANIDGSAAEYLDDTPRPESGWISPRADGNYVFYIRREFGLFRIPR